MQPAPIKTIIIGSRETPEVYAAVQDAAAAEGISVSAWVSRRLRNNLRRTGRLAEPTQRQTTA